LLKLTSLLKYYHTLKYLKPRQTVGRAYAAIKRKINLVQIKVPKNLTIKKFSIKVPFLNHDPWNSAEEILKGNFTFLNKQASLGQPIEWDKDDASLLWKFNLHYFNYLYLLDQNHQKKICLEWIQNNPISKSAAWSPYTISIRIVNWCKANIEDDEINQSLFLQTNYLSKNLEFYHPGNHYLENAKALIFAGFYFSENRVSKKWLEKGIKIFSKELPIQVLSDGGYFERTQMYHALMLHGFLDVINILPAKSALYNRLSSVLKNMLDFLKSNTHPNGEIALFNDSTTEIAPSTKSLIDYAGKLLNHTPEFKSSFPDSGYYIYKDEDVYMIIDAGAIGPNYLPAHAHADIFSYELSLNGKKVIVDMGVYEYKRGVVRQRLRSTQSHNTVAIDTLDQVECWDSFRVARRYGPTDISFKEFETGFQFEGTYSGYSKLIGDNISHQRTIRLDKKNREITISEKVSGKNEHLVESYIHLAPETEIFEDENTVSIHFEGGKFNINVLNGIKEIANSTYYPKFGEHLSNNNIILKKFGNLPVQLNYVIAY
jgi:uncharacterized heparinase superfamily protein